MNTIKILVFAFLLSLVLSSCSKNLTPFSKRMYDDLELTEADLKRVQFYLSEDIVLQRKRGTSNSRIDDGQIQLKDGSEIERIVFKKGTPGVFLFSPKKDRFAISFEEKGDNFLIFGPNKRNGGEFNLRGKEWDKRYGQVSYKGKVYTTTSSSAFAGLLVDFTSERDRKYKSRSVGGRTIRK